MELADGISASQQVRADGLTSHPVSTNRFPVVDYLAGRASPRDGRFDLAVLVHRDGCWPLTLEGPATQSEALAALRSLASVDGKAPQRNNAPGFGDLGGCWSVWRLGRPEAAIQIRHPRQIALVREHVPTPEPTHGFTGRAEPTERV